MKHPTACTQCRLSKRKCFRRDGQKSCSYCRLKGLASDCSLVVEAKKRPVSSQRIAPAIGSLVPPSKEIDPLLTQQNKIELTELYLTFIHDRPQTIFHAPTLREQVQKGQISKPLLLAVCGLGCRFSPQDALRLMESVLIVASKKALHAALAVKNIEAVQACILIANLCAANLDPDGEALYFGFAISIARVMRLFETRDDDDAITREIKCRVWWTLFMADRWCSASSGLPRQIGDSSDDKIRLPIEEHAFQNSDFGGPSTLAALKPGLWAYRITLVQVFACIQDLHRQVVEARIDQGQVDERVSELKSMLNDWEQELPVSSRFSLDTLQTYRERRLGGSFIDMHLGFHYYATLLFFIYLDVHRPSHPDTARYPQLCKYHALEFSHLLAISRKTPGCEVVHLTVGHMAVVSSAALIHTLLFEHESEHQASREGLLSNFETMLQLQKLWPSMHSLISRLFKFQKTCLNSADKHTHRVDRWMSHFLFEYNPPSEPMENVGAGLKQLLQI